MIIIVINTSGGLIGIWKYCDSLGMSFSCMYLAFAATNPGGRFSAEFSPAGRKPPRVYHVLQGRSVCLIGTGWSDIHNYLESTMKSNRSGNGPLNSCHSEIHMLGSRYSPAPLITPLRRNGQYSNKMLHLLR